MNIRSGTAWAILSVVGMILLAIGFVGYIDVIPTGELIAMIIFCLGIILVVLATIYIRLERRDVVKEIDEYDRGEAVRSVVAEVPNDLKGGYIIDLTADIEYMVVSAEDLPSDVPESMDGIPAVCCASKGLREEAESDVVERLPSSLGGDGPQTQEEYYYED